MASSPKQRYSFPKEKLKVLLLEGIHQAAIDYFKGADYSLVETSKAAMNEDELAEIIPSVHILGIRSKTNLSAANLKRAENLLAVGCFCIGTNQVDLSAAAAHGVPVFNAPFSNTRSVAELVLAEVVMLTRKAAQRSLELHQGIWTKSADNCYEVRGKTIGIVGYGHIGPQVGVLAEAFGMRVIVYDIQTKLALGNARQVATLDELLEESDFVTLHVPETPETKGMIGERELKKMKKGSYLLNLSRGTVVDIEALAAAVKSKHIDGVAVDVYPYEPKSNEEEFISPLRGLENVIMTPHIGGSTIEAQRNIGLEVATSLIKFVDIGSSSGAVNFPNVELAPQEGTHRVLNIHRNVPGVLSEINKIIADMGGNISGQYLATNPEMGYLIMDVGRNVARDVKRAIDAMPANIKTRLLF